MPSRTGVRQLGRDWGAALAGLCRPAPMLFLVQLTLALLSGGLVPVSALALSRLLGLVAVRAPSADLVLASIAVAAATTSVSSLTVLSRFVQAESNRRIGLANKADLLARVNAISGLEPLEDPAFLDRLRLAERAGTTAPQTFGLALFTALRAAITTGGFVLALSWTAPVLIGLSAVAVLASVVAAAADTRRRLQLSEHASARTRREMFYAGLMTDVRAATEIRLFGSSAVLQARMMHEISAVAAAERTVDRIALIRQLQLALIVAVTTGCGLLWAAALAGRGQLDVAELSIVATAVAGLQVSGQAMVIAVAEGSRAAGLFRHYVDHPPRALASRPTGAVAPLRAGIEFCEVWFAYPGGPPVLRGVNLFIPAGGSVALVGLNGAGKSTLIKLLCRLYEPAAGRIRWDGTDIATMDPELLRARVSALMQDFVRYDLSAADNIGLGRPSRIEDRPAIRTAARLAGAHDTLQRLPSGYDTQLSRAFTGSGAGSQLSGGQWQRVALARAMLRTEADLLILDEPTAGLDAMAEADVRDLLRTTAGHRSILLISHKLALVRRADLIAVLSDGRVAEVGSHLQLLAAGGEYARLFTLQAEGYQPLAS